MKLAKNFQQCNYVSNTGRYSGYQCCKPCIENYCDKHKYHYTVRQSCGGLII